MQFDSLQFGGGAHYAVLFLGSLHKLILNGIVDLEKIKTFGGSSAGSVIAVLLNVGFTPKEIFEELIAADLEDIFLNDVNITKLFTNNGFCYGKTFVERVVQIIQKKIPTFTIKSTFDFLQNHTKKTLVVSGTNLTQKKVDLFCQNFTPNMSVVYAIRLSISIPLLFQSLQYKNNYYVDGAWFHDIRDSEQCGDFFKKATSLHFVIRIPSGGVGSMMEIISLLRAFFVDYFWVTNLEKYPHVIENTVDATSYDKNSLLFLYQRGIVNASNCIDEKMFCL